MKQFNTTIVCIGTGPSLTLEQIDVARQKGFTLFGCNNTFQIVPDLAVLYACNLAWWDCYYEEVKSHRCQKWTTNNTAASTYGLNWIAEQNAPGLSTHPSIVHHGHGSGFTMLNLAYLMGATRIILLGYDLKYAPDYNGKECKAGQSPRHYFGEYPNELQHWPSVQVKEGVHVGLLALYESVAKQNLIEIINCTPDSALSCFPTMDIRDVN